MRETIQNIVYQYNIIVDAPYEEKLYRWTINDIL